jgi:hypothetical protein
MKTPKFAKDGIHRCDNCGDVNFGEDLDDITDLLQRIEADGIVPSGQCPRCGCLAYAFKSAPTLPERRFADLSTVYMSYDDSQLLTKWSLEQREGKCCGPDSLIVHDYREGYYVYVGGNDGEFMEYINGVTKISEGLRNLLVLAHLQGFTYVNFDADGDKVEGLQEFEWPSGVSYLALREAAK